MAPAIEPVATRHRGLMLGLLIGTVVLLLGFAAFALVRQFEAERTLHEVARAAAVPATAPAAALGGGQGTDTSRADASPAARTPDTADEVPAQAQAPAPAAAVPSVQDVTAAAQSLAPGAMAVGSGAAVAAAANPGGATNSLPSGGGRDTRADTAETSQARVDRASEEARPTTARGTKQAGKGSSVAAAKGAEKQSPKSSPKSSVKRAKAAAERRAARRAVRADDTFRRCPPLGKKGAVTCRVHICNGGAGKERACRPYLERSP